MNHNLVQLGGNLVRDIELKYLTSGTPVADFSIAINRVWFNDRKEKQEEVTFAGCTAFGKTAENIAKYFHKGEQVFVQGRLKQDTWEKDGVKQSKTKVIVESFEFIGGKKSEAAAPPRQAPRSAPRTQADPDLDVPADVPF